MLARPRSNQQRLHWAACRGYCLGGGTGGNCGALTEREDSLPHVLPGAAKIGAAWQRARSGRHSALQAVLQPRLRTSRYTRRPHAQYPCQDQRLGSPNPGAFAARLLKLLVAITAAPTLYPTF